MGKRHSRLSPEETEELVQTTHCELVKKQRMYNYTLYTDHPAVSPQELNQWYKGFLKDCPSGSVDEKVSRTT